MIVDLCNVWNKVSVIDPHTQKQMPSLFPFQAQASRESVRLLKTLGLLCCLKWYSPNSDPVLWRERISSLCISSLHRPAAAERRKAFRESKSESLYRWKLCLASRVRHCSQNQNKFPTSGVETCLVHCTVRRESRSKYTGICKSKLQLRKSVALNPELVIFNYEI